MPIARTHNVEVNMIQHMKPRRTLLRYESRPCCGSLFSVSIRISCSGKSVGIKYGLKEVCNVNLFSRRIITQIYTRYYSSAWARAKPNVRSCPTGGSAGVGRTHRSQAWVRPRPGSKTCFVSHCRGSFSRAGFRHCQLRGPKLDTWRKD